MGGLFRRRRWLILLGVLLVVRAALPEVLRRVLRSQLSQRLQTRVEIGDVDLALHRGGVALEDVALFSPTPEAPDEPPLVSWRRFAVELRYLPILWKTAQLRRVELEGPHVVLDRLANGELNLQRLVPASEPAPAEPAPEAAQGSGWKMGIDSFALRAGGIRFRDLTLPEGEPLEIAIPDVSVGEVALQPGLYGEPGRARLYVKTEGGALRVDSRIWVLDKGFALGTRLKAFRLPLRRARLYVPGVGWSELRGELDAVIDHGIAPGGKNALSGMVRLRQVAIQVPDLPSAAFAVERLAVQVDPVDLGARRVRVRRLDIGGASVVVDLQGGEVLPLLRKGVEAPPATAPAETTSPQAEAAAAPPWHWAVDVLELADSKVSLLQEGAPLDVGITVSGRGLADEGDPGRIRTALAVEPGSLTVEGAVRPLPPGFGGTVRIQQLPVHDLVRAARAAARLPQGLLQAAALDADLAVAAGVAADGAAVDRPDAVAVKGTVGLDGLRVEGPDAALFAVGWKRLALPIDALELPGLLPAAPGSAPVPPAPIRAVFGAVRLEEPTVQVTRNADGFVLPSPLGGAPAAEGEAPAPAAPVAEPPPPAAPAPVVTVDSFVLSHGRIGLADQTVKPFFAGEIKPLEVDARGIRSEGPRVDRFTLSAATPQKGKIGVTGSFRPEGGTIRVNGEAVALTPYNPFVTSFANYSLGRGSTLSVKTDVTFGKGKYDAKTTLTLHRLSVKGAAGDTLFKQQFGIPLSLALALLRDSSGNIKLDIPVAADEAGTKVGLGTVLAGALRSAIVGAVTSPLKGLGMVFGGGDQDVALEPPPITTQVGRAVLTPDGEKQVGQLAAFLAGRPGVGVELDPVVTQEDARWLREQDLRAELEARTGMVNALRGLPERNSRRRILEALAARAEGKPAELEGDDAERLEKWLAERPALPPERLRALATERAAAVTSNLRDRHGIQADRVTTTEAKGEPRQGVPAVLIAFTAAGE